MSEKRDRDARTMAYIAIAVFALLFLISMNSSGKIGPRDTGFPGVPKIYQD